VCRALTASKYSSDLTQSQSPSLWPHSLNHSLEVHLVTDSILASNCIFRTARLQAAISLHHGVQLHPRTCSIMASKFAGSWPPTAGPKLLDCILKVCTIMASNCVSKLALLRHWSSHSHGLHTHISKLAQSLVLSACPASLDYGLQVLNIMAWNCICHLARLQPSSSHNLFHQVHITKLARLRSHSVSLSPLNHGLQVYLQILSITTSKSISKLAGSWFRSVSLRSLDCQFVGNLELLSNSTCSQTRYIMCTWVAIYIRRWE